MPDLHILDARVCASVLAWRDMVGVHEVLWVRAPAGHPYAMRMVCDCKGFRFRKTCRHIVEAQKMRCNWGAGAFSGSPSTPNPDGTCPECGGPTVGIRVGV